MFETLLPYNTPEHRHCEKGELPDDTCPGGQCQGAISSRQGRDCFGENTLAMTDVR